MSPRIGARIGARLIAASDHLRAAQLLDEAVRLLPEVASRRLERADQQQAIGRFLGLTADAAALTLSDSTTPEPERAARALQLLEAGRAVLLSQALETRSDLSDLRDQYPGLATRFIDLRDELDRPASAELAPVPAPRTGPTSDWRPRVAEDMAAVLSQIRALDGFGSFALPPALEDLLDQAAAGPVITFNTGSAYRSDALLLTEHGVTVVPLPGLARESVVDKISAFHQALSAAQHPDPGTDPAEAEDTIREILAWLWDAAAQPVLTALGYTSTPPPGATWPRVWWVTGGLLGLLPIHAAGHHTSRPDAEQRTVMDRVVSSYTPTIRALGYARQHTAPLDPGLPDTAGQALIVAMPTTPGLRGNGRLPNVATEIALLRAHLT